jgi:beta-lactamase class A
VWDRLLASSGTTIDALRHPDRRTAMHRHPLLTRRQALIAPAALALGACATGAKGDVRTAAPAKADGRFSELEHRYDARLGVWALDTGSGRHVAHRAEERFAHCSTIKALSAGCVLHRRSLEQLEDVITYSRADLVTYSPITELHVDEGMTVRAVCDAAIRFSDNTAANLMLDDLGGPRALTAALRAIGDRRTRSDRRETALNSAIPGERLDTSTPRALARSLKAFAVDDALESEAKRAVLTSWLVSNTTGDALIRAGLPAGWRVGDKTGSGGYGTRNDIAVAWPPRRKPIVLAILSTRSRAEDEHDDTLIAEAASIVASRLS